MQRGCRHAEWAISLYSVYEHTRRAPISALVTQLERYRSHKEDTAE